MAKKNLTAADLAKLPKKKPSKPKFKALPKRPKSSATAEAWKKYEDKLKEVQDENCERNKQYEKDLKDWDRVVEFKKDLQSRTAGAKPIPCSK